VSVINAPSGFALDAPTTESDDAVLLFVRDRDELETLGEPFFRTARDDRLPGSPTPRRDSWGPI
jgi:hypothetical protein